jgi:CheY-like chemotaxis protein
MPCLIFLDLLMPNNGWQFRAEQMAHPKWSTIPVVVGTGLNRRPEAVAPELDIPPDQYLLKPFDLGELVGIVERFCR